MNKKGGSQWAKKFMSSRDTFYKNWQNQKEFRLQCSVEFHTRAIKCWMIDEERQLIFPGFQNQIGHIMAKKSLMQIGEEEKEHHRESCGKDEF